MLDEILRDTEALVRAVANPRRGTITLSAHTAELLESIKGSPPAPAPEPVVEEELAPRPDPTGALAELAAEVAECRKCKLCETRTQTVFSDGSPMADVVFVGEAPGENEDRQGVPFVGRAGQLLTDIIEKGMLLRREEVYICNVLKCRPPNNRDPLVAEKEQCVPYLIRQLELIQPKVICALGGHAAKTLLNTDESTGKLRGHWHFYGNIPVRVTYHPAYLLRDESQKRKTWEDIQEVMKVLDGSVTPRPTDQDISDRLA
jgi:uracil-DNA glycosylase